MGSEGRELWAACLGLCSEWTGHLGLCSEWTGHLGLCFLNLHRACQAPLGRKEKQETWVLW